MDGDVRANSTAPVPRLNTTETSARRSEQLTIRRRVDETAVTLHVHGVIDSITAPMLATQLEFALSLGATLLIVDLAEVQFFSAAGIELLVEVQCLTEGFATELRVVAVGPITGRPLRVLGVDALLHVYPTVDAARGAHS